MVLVLIGLHLLISKFQKGNQDTTKLYKNQLLGKSLQGCKTILPIQNQPTFRVHKGNDFAFLFVLY